MSEAQGVGRTVTAPRPALTRPSRIGRAGDGERAWSSPDQSGARRDYPSENPTRPGQEQGYAPGQNRCNRSNPQTGAVIHRFQRVVHNFDWSRPCWSGKRCLPVTSRRKAEAGAMKRWHPRLRTPDPNPPGL